MANEKNDIYIDLLLSNSIQTHSNSRVAVSFSQSQSQPVLKSTNGYKLSIIRFSLDTQTLPIFIPTMQSKDTTIYSISMTLNGVTIQKFMKFEPQNLNPVDIDEYYYIYNYQYLIYLVNQCFISCAAELDDVLYSPRMDFDNDTQKCSINIDTSMYGYNEENKINIYMNDAMAQLFFSLPMMNVNKNYDGLDYQLNNLISNNNSIMTQNYSTINFWNPVNSIVFTSNLLPIYESTTLPIQIYREGLLTNNSSNYNFLNIVTDFIGNDLLFVPFLQYAPSIYRYISLKPNNYIKDIDLQLMWINKHTGLMKNVYIGVGGNCSIKLVIN